jgi:hypothetical protein
MHRISIFNKIVCLMVFISTFNNISIISWRSVLLVEETGRPGENHRPVASHWQASCILFWTTLISANLFWIKLYLNYLAFLFFFTMTYLMKVISETRCVHYIIYLRFLCNISVLHWYIIRWCKWRWKPISMWWLEMNWAK